MLTTTYLGATDRKVLDELAAAGARVRISYDTRRTRLHAKAWLFHRDSGYSTALVGSSNLSAAAITDGLEWNVRLSHVETPQVLRQFQTAFEQYWEEGEFEAYDPTADAWTELPSLPGATPISLHMTGEGPLALAVMGEDETGGEDRQDRQSSEEGPAGAGPGEEVIPHGLADVGWMKLNLVHRQAS